MPPVIKADGNLLSKISWDEDESAEDSSYYYEDKGDLTQTTVFSTGGATGQINDVYHDDVTLPPGALTALRLDAILVTLFNRTYLKSFQRVNSLQIHNLSEEYEIYVDQSVADPLDFLPDSAMILPGGVFQLEGEYDIALPNDGIGLRNDSEEAITIHVTVLGVFDA
jgi:hypothetical protein